MVLKKRVAIEERFCEARVPRRSISSTFNDIRLAGREALNCILQYGLLAVVREAARRARRESLPCFVEVARELDGKRGIEIGGPTHRFGKGHLLPIYQIAARIDNVTFPREDLSVKLEEGDVFHFCAGRPPGYQYLRDATDLSTIPSETYDFLLSSHSLEHIANPIKALTEWKRVLRADGILLLVLPHKDNTFDHRRRVTTLDHMVSDYEHGAREDDCTHVRESLDLHDLRKGPTNVSKQDFERRVLHNSQHRCLHHHVFITEMAIRLLDYANLQVTAVDAVLPHHIVAVSRKVGVERANNEELLSADAPFRRQSPFLSDRTPMK